MFFCSIISQDVVFHVISQIDICRYSDINCFNARLLDVLLIQYTLLRLFPAIVTLCYTDLVFINTSKPTLMKLRLFTVFSVFYSNAAFLVRWEKENYFDYYDVPVIDTLANFLQSPVILIAVIILTIFTFAQLQRLFLLDEFVSRTKFGVRWNQNLSFWLTNRDASMKNKISQEHSKTIERCISVLKSNAMQAYLPPCLNSSIHYHELEFDKEVSKTDRSEVFVAVYRNVVVAVKQLMKQENFDGLMGFICEIYLQSTLKHPNIVSVVGAVYEYPR